MATSTHNYFKRKKNATEFTAENINNTAPVRKILDELQDKNSQAYMFYCHNLKQRLTTQKALQNYHFVVPGHPLNSFNDDWDGELNIDYFESFPYKSFLPKIITEFKNITEADPVTSFMKSKMSWQRDCRKIKLTAAFTNMIQKYEALNDEVVQCPKHIVDIAAHLDSDPDPYFDSSYNWYYSGNGNLQVVCIDWVDYLLHSEFSSLYLSQYNRNDLTLKPNIKAIFDCGKDNNILETICSSQNIIALRTKYKVYILRVLTTDDDVKIEKLKGIDSEMPYTGISFDTYHKNILYITTLDNNLSIVNLDRLKAKRIKLKGKLTSLVDNWNTVIGSERGFYTHVGRQNITLYDKRYHDTIYVWKNIRNITDEIACNDISVAKHLESSTSLYIGTDHHLFLMDMRYQHQNKASMVQRWTHGMECVPTYLTNCNFEFNKDLICLSSQWCEDMCMVPNYNTRSLQNTGVCVPYRPPNILNTLNEARERRLCYDLYNPIDARLSTSITGLLVLEQDDKYNILMQNSLGDISCHTLFPEHFETFIEDDSTQCLQDWCASHCIEKKDFEVSTIQNIANLWKQFKEVPADLEIFDSSDNEVSKFDKDEIVEAFESEIDSGLREAWLQPSEEETMEPSSLMLNLYFSEDEE